MFIKFNGVEKNYEATSVIEQKIYKQGDVSGWLLSLQLNGDFTAEEFDNTLSKESIKSITLGSENGVKIPFSGYNRVTSCVVRYLEDKNTAEIQLLKEM